MVKKYWWEDDYQQSASQPGTKNSKKYWWEDDASSTGNIASNKVNKWLSNYNSYITDYQKRYEGRQGGYSDAYVSDSADWLNTVTQQKAELDSGASEIFSYLEQNKGTLDQKWVTELTNSINGALTNYNNLVKGATEENAYWNSFNPNEEQLAAGYTAEKIYGDWQKEQKQYESDMGLNIYAAEQQLQQLKDNKASYFAELDAKEREGETFWDALGNLGKWLSTSPDSMIPLAGNTNSLFGNSEKNAYDQKIADLEAQIERAKYVQGYEGYMKNMDAADYGAMSKYVSTRNPVKLEDAVFSTHYGHTDAEGNPVIFQEYDTKKLFGNFLHDYINKNEDALTVASRNDVANMSSLLGHDMGFLQTMSKDEIGVYNYIYNTQGQEAANAYLTHIESDLTGRKRAQEQAFWASYAKSDPVGSSVFSVLTSPLKGVSYIGQAADLIHDGKLDKDAGYNRLSYIPSTIRNQVSTTIENSGWGKVGSFAYNTGMSMADFLFNTAISGGNQALSLGIMGSGAAADTTLAAKDRGLSDWQAFTLGTIAGAAEIAMEKISLGAWLDGDMTEGALRYVLKNALSEGVEEAGTSIVNLLADVMIAGNKSEWKIAMQKHIDEGKSPQEAFGLVAAENAAQIGLDALGGALSGSVISGSTYVASSIASGLQYGNIAKNKDFAQKLTAEGLELNPDSKYVQKMKAKVDGGKSLSGMQVRNILAKNQEQITANDMKAIQQAAEKRLTDLGQTEKVSELAEIVAKYVTGGELTRAERKLLTNSENGSKVQHDLLQDSLVKEVNSEGYESKAIRSVLNKMASMEHPNAYKSLESRMEGETPAKVSDTGKAVIRGTDEAIDLKKARVTEFITDKKTGKVTDMTIEADGKVVKASEIDYADDSQSYLFSAVSKIENITPADATAIVRDYDPSSGLSVSEYLNGVDEAFTYGYHNYSEADLKAGDFTQKLGDTMAKSAYVLGQNAKNNSKTKGTEAVKRMRTAVNAEAENAAKDSKEAPKARKLTITYNHGGGVVEDIATAEKKLGKLNKWQRGGIEVVKILHQLGIGTDYELFTSYYSKTLKDENGNPLEVFLNDEGQEEAAYAGVYMAADGKIRINLKAYSGTKGLTLNALSHELTHFIKTWSLEKYEAMADFLVKSYGEKGVSMHKLVLKEQARLKGVRGKDVSYTEAYDEVVANAFNRMLEDGKVMDRIAEIRQFDKSLADKIIECIRNFINKFTKAYQQNKSLFHETKALMEMKEVFEQLQEMFAEALVEASDNFQASLIAKEAGLEVAPVEDSTQYSYQSLAEAAGFEAVENENGTRSFVRDGQAVSEVTVEDIENSPIGAFINFSLEMGDISDADAKRQKKMFADICTMACKTNDFAMTMQFVGSAVFTGMKANADKQYGTTYDFPSICTKTQAVIDAMSAKMVSLGRGLTTDEIVQLYDNVFASGNPVPCPECYVFSRWIGIGGLLDNIKKYQDYYGDMAVEDVAAEYRKMKAEVSKFAEEQGISFGKAKGALTSKLTKEFNKLTEKIEKQQNQGEKVKASDIKRLEELEPMMNTVKGMTWLENVYFADSSLKKVNPKFRVPNDVLFDLNNGEAFATQYKDAWAFRTTQGAGYGKAITPYAEARLGEGVLVTNNTTNAIKGKAQGSLDNYFLNQMGKLDKKSRDALKRARLKQKIQAFIGGQRFQSTSDARYENASDYLLAALEMQAMRGMVQVYTKVDGAVPAFSAWGFSINQSLMPLNGGLDADGNVKDTGVGGMKPEVAFENRKKHETAGTITIGVNDNHIRAMFKQLVRDFIIPYHASGGKADVVAAFRRIQEGKEAKGKAIRSTDYSRTQSDKVLSDDVLRWQGKTEAQIQRIHEIRNARIAILTGGKPNMTVVRSNRFLSALYDKLNGGEWDGVKLAKSKVESQIFPNEFWDQTVTYEESAKITKDYLEYCEDLGFLHRFSGMVPSNGKLVPVNGYNENGERVQLTDLAYKYDGNGNKTAEVEEFFWKVLTDRRMYDNNGNYLTQKVVTLNDTTTETVTGFAKNNQSREYDKAKAEALAKKIVKGWQYSSQKTDLDTDADSAYDGGRNKTEQGDKTDVRRKESREEFDQRTGAEVLRKGQKGRLAYAYRPHLGTAISENARTAEKELKKMGIPVFIYEELESNSLGVTTNHKRAGSAALPGVGVFVPFNADVNPMEIVGHEGFHFLVGYVDRSNYISVLIDNVDFASSDFIAYQTKYVQEKYFEEEVGTEDDGFSLLTEEIFAYITGDIYSGDTKGEVHKFLRDYDAVKAAWNDLVQKQTEKKGKQYSSQQTDLDAEEVPYRTVLENLNEYSLDDLISIAVQLTDGMLTDWHSMSKDSLVRILREAISLVGRDYPDLTFKLPVTEMEQIGDESVDDWILEDDTLPFQLEDTAKNVEPNYRPSNADIKSYFDDMLSWMRRSGIKVTETTMEEYAKANGVDAVVEEMLADWGTEYSSKEPTHKMIDSIQAELRDLPGEDYEWDEDQALFDRVKSVVEDVLAKHTADKAMRYSTQQTDNITDRDMLANAFETISKSSAEYEMIQDYKSNVDRLNKLERELDEVNQEIRKVRFVKGEYNKEKLKVLEGKASQLAGRITKYDKMLLNMEASAPLRKVIQQERKKEAQKTKAHVKEIQQNKKVRAEQTELRHKIRKAIRDLNKILNRGNKKQNVKEDMKDFVSKALELADYLFTDHVSNDDLIRRGITVRMTPKEAALVKETEDILSKLYDNADSLTDEEFTSLDAKRKANEDKLRDLLTAQRNERLNTPVYNLFNDLVTEYASLKNSKQDAVKAAYNEELENSLRAFISDDDRVKILKNMRVADMTTEELNWLYRAYTMVLNNVRNANKFFAKGMTESIDKVVTQVVMDFGSRKIPEKKLAIAAQKIANKIGWDYEKLYYALDRIGSDAFTELIMNIADSENTVMQDIMEAVEFRDKIVEKYGFNNWDVNKKIDREFLDNTGKKFTMTLGQLMSLYAYSRREGAWDHIEYGGFVFGEKALTDPKPASSYKLSKDQCEAIIGLLTKEQRGYVEDMQKFLSEVMGEKGNEVSMLLYGIKMFAEENYFPIHVAGQFKAQANESQAKAAAGFQSMSNAGFTHAQNPNAKAPFVLEGFNEVWTDHVNEMSRYHGTVPALEDLRRVMNRSSYSDSTAESTSVKVVMENHFGEEALRYFDNLYREANSGAITDKLQNKSKKLLSLFRKNSVAYSLSVIIQQPASLVRAYAMIDKKYFGFKGFGAISSGFVKAVSSKWNPAYANAYNEMLKYAPGVTMAKEIGGFDTATGGSIRSYLLDTGKSLKQKWNTGTAKEKAQAALNVVDNNAIANLPNVADKIAWIEIWNACKRETVATHKNLATNSEEFMQAVGERFTEVIRATQVYDSIFAKSPMLKSKNLAVQYLVSFMNEPNTIANMAESAMRDVTKGNWKKGARTAAVVAYSIIFTNVLKSIIYAMRDDDEDETYIEKYIEAITGGMMDDINPFNYIPIARDAWSIAQGYDVERADMAIVADAIGALNNVIKNASTQTDDMTEEQLVEFDKKVTEANWQLVEALAAFFGIPVKNIRREINGVLDHARIASANAGKTTANSAWDKISDAVIDSIPFVSNKESKTGKLYDAIISGDTAYRDRLKSTYKDESAYNSAVRKALRENDSRIHDAAQARYDGNTEDYKRIFREIQKEGKFTFDEIMDAVNSEENAIKNKLEPEKVTSSYSASDFVEVVSMGDSSSAKAIMDDLVATYVANGKTQEEAEKAFASAVTTSTHDAYSGGLLDEAGAKNMLMEYADKDEEEAASKVSYWSFCEENPKYDYFTESNVKDYREFAEPANISLEVYAQFLSGTKGLADIKDKWGDVEVTKREQVLEVIDSLPITWQQKDALYLAAGYSESKIWDVPW